MYSRNGAGRPAFLLHGLAASHHDWDMLAPELNAAGYETFAPDLPGHGKSIKPGPLRDFELENVVGALEKWITSLDVEPPFVLVGHSMGGYLSLELTIRHPGLVEKLVLVDPLYSFHRLPLTKRFLFEERFLSRTISYQLPEWLYAGMVGMTSLFFPGVNILRHDLPPDARKQMAANYKDAVPGIYRYPFTGRDLAPLLSFIDIPVLLVYGLHDGTLNPESFQTMGQCIRDIRVKPLKAGHIPHQSNAADFNRLVMEFLNPTKI
jgi:pimeloyl-ACP methyl ester carboxylesterase